MYLITSLLKTTDDPKESMLKFKANYKKGFYKDENMKDLLSETMEEFHTSYQHSRDCSIEMPTLYSQL